MSTVQILTVAEATTVLGHALDMARHDGDQRPQAGLPASVVYRHYPAGGTHRAGVAYTPQQEQSLVAASLPVDPDARRALPCQILVVRAGHGGAYPDCYRY